jgi:hypothetical protein
LPFAGLNPKRVDFTRYGLLGVFYKPSFGWGMNVTSVGQADGDAGILLVDARVFHGFCPDPRTTVCGEVTPIPRTSWGFFTVVAIDKAGLRDQPKGVWVRVST